MASAAISGRVSAKSMTGVTTASQSGRNTNPCRRSAAPCPGPSNASTL
ncbi:MAG TPA: hypothetical protein VGH72_31600 [Pseudonocardia sp.]